MDASGLGVSRPILNSGTVDFNDLCYKSEFGFLHKSINGKVHIIKQKLYEKTLSRDGYA